MYKLVIFDMDGLLIDSERKMWMPNMKQTLGEMNYEQDEKFLHTLAGSSKDTSTHLFYERFGNDFDVDYFYKHLYELNEIIVSNNKVPLKEGVKEIISFLKENNIDFCLGTSSNRDYATTVLRNTGVLNDFKHIICGDEVKETKPAPDIYLKCMSYYNYKPHECLVLEDAHNGAKAAITAKAKCCLIPDVGILSDWDYQNCYIVNSLFDAIEIIKRG